MPTRPRSEDDGAPAPPPGYRAGVGLILIGPQRRIFVGRRTGAGAGWWQMPQGGVDSGESPRQAAWRELREEVGTDRAILLAESDRWHIYEVPVELRPPFWQGRWRGQAQRWFAFRFTGSDQDIDLDADAPEFDDWRWAGVDEVLDAVVDFKRPVYEAVLAEFRHLLR
jgi:putative (di)nucleoside polyphosphate hydrolase